MITIKDLKVGDKFTTHETEGVFTVLRTFIGSEDVNASMQCSNSNDIYTHDFNDEDLINLNIKLIRQ